jgi:vacuolar iron transporter family protein
VRKSLKEVRETQKHIEAHSRAGAMFKEFILGGQDGLVNVLGVILGVAIATMETRVVIIAGLAAAFAESFSMAAVAYTSSKAEEDYFEGQRTIESKEIQMMPKRERKEIYDIYYKKGFRGKLLDDIVNQITKNKKMWLSTMMREELDLSNKFIHPVKSAFVVGLAAIVGSIIPLLTFFFFPVKTAIIFSLILSAICLFITGVIESRLTVGNWFKKGIQLTVIGMVAAGIGFVIGKIFGVA